jgi:hypothetical protein
MALRLPELDVRQQAVLASVLDAIRAEDVQGVRDSLFERSLERKAVWLPPPLLTVIAALLTLIVESVDGPWELGEDVWDKHLPDSRPHGRSQWRNATYALQAGASLAGGVWLDVGLQESYWRIPLWPFALDAVELLTVIATTQLNLTPEDLANRLTALVTPTP